MFKDHHHWKWSDRTSCEFCEGSLERQTYRNLHFCRCRRWYDCLFGGKSFLAARACVFECRQDWKSVCKRHCETCGECPTDCMCEINFPSGNIYSILLCAPKFFPEKCYQRTGAFGRGTRTENHSVRGVCFYVRLGQPHWEVRTKLFMVSVCKEKKIN